MSSRLLHETLRLCVIDFVRVRHSGQGEEKPRGARELRDRGGGGGKRGLWISARANSSAHTLV